jgi:adenine-specific DNA-methyltransferase
MKYMGNKSKMLPVLSEVLAAHAVSSEKIADAFCGSATVSWHMAEFTDKVIVAGDIQSFAVARASAVIERVEAVDPERMLKLWFSKAGDIVNAVANHFPNHLKSIEPDLTNSEYIKTVVEQSRKFCEDVLPVVFRDFKGAWPISKAYGGYYYSPVQALVFDALRQSLPRGEAHRKIAVAALIEAASKAAASPGHTAQPFQPTESSAKYIIEAWLRNPWELVSSSVKEISAKSANKVGKGVVGDFTKTIAQLNPGDLVFADPPYSGVHYSRFYHALETITRGTEFIPEGRGRYPSIKDRPSSAFSKRSESTNAASQLIEMCAERKLALVLTFPTGLASNGLSSNDFVHIGRPLFSKIKIEEFQTDFSTLGGNKKHRAARQSLGEAIVSFIP